MDEAEETADREMRKRQLRALTRVGITPDVLAESYRSLIELNEAEGNAREQRLLLHQLTDLMGSRPRRRTSIDVRSDQRVISLQLGEGSVGGLSAEELRQLPLEKRRQYMALLSEVRDNGQDEGKVAVPEVKRLRVREDEEDEMLT